MRHSSIRCWFGLVIAFYGQAASLCGTPAGPTPATRAEEVALQQGILPNGFRYAFLPHSTEPGRVSLRLIVHAGSLDEHDNERGFAHFVEHMAFNGTRHYPPGKLIQFFQRLGLTWGADANAETSGTSTVYKLDLPAGHANHLGEALQVLADYADSISFDPAEVRRERGVILSEQGARDTDEWQINSQLISLYYAGTLIPERLPFGDRAQIRSADASSLRHFYERCYRPERMTLVIVGDVAGGLPLNLIQEHFAHLHVVGPGAAQVLPAPLVAPGVATHVVATPLSNSAAARIVAIAPVLSDTTAVIEETLGAGVAIGLLNRRMHERQTALSPRIQHAEAYLTQGFDNRYFLYGLEADTANNEWPAALGMIENELRRARLNGFTSDETKEMVSALLAGFRANASDFAGQTADHVANGITAILATGRGWRDPASLLAIADHYFSTFTPTMASDRLRVILPEDQFHLIIMSPRAPGGGADAILAAYRASALQSLVADPVKPERELRFPYGDFGPPGAIAERTKNASLGIEMVRFANGARLNLRPTDSEPGRFRLWARLGRGTADIPRELPGINLLATALMGKSNLGRLTRDELARLTGAHAVDGNWTFDDNDFFIQLTGPSAELPFALSSLTAYLSDVKLEASKLSDALSLYPQLTGSFVTSTIGRTKVEGIFRATGDDPRFRLPDQAEVKRYSYEVVSSWLRTHWLEGPLEIGLTGDIKSDEAIATVAATIGTLSPRREFPPLAEERIVFRPKTYRNLTFIDLPDKTASVRVFWPIHDAKNLRVYRGLRFAAATLEERLRVTLRQELGATYAPGAAVFRSAAQPDFGFVCVDLTFDPKSAQKLAERTIKVAVDFARRGMSKEEFARLREPLRVTAMGELRSNDWWLTNVLTRVQSQPSVLEEARTHGVAFDDLTLDEVNRVAAAQFSMAESNAVGFIPQARPLSKKK